MPSGRPSACSTALCSFAPNGCVVGAALAKGRPGLGPRAAAQLVGVVVAGNGGLAAELAAHRRRALARTGD